jgi:hypothetical protein
METIICVISIILTGFLLWVINEQAKEFANSKRTFPNETAVLTIFATVFFVFADVALIMDITNKLWK